MPHPLIEGGGQYHSQQVCKIRQQSYSNVLKSCNFDNQTFGHGKGNLSHPIIISNLK